MNDNALPVAGETAEASAPVIEAPADQVEGNEAEPKPEDEQKPEKTPEQRELERARRKIDRLVRQREELRAQVGLTRSPQEGDNRQQQDDSEQLTLSRAQLQEIVKAEASKLAPTLSEQRAAIEHRQSLVASLAKDWGQEKFDAMAADLDEAFGGLTDRSGKPKPATDAIFESEAPKDLIEYLADPEHADEAEALSALSPTQAGRAIAKLELKVAAAKEAAKPKASKAPAPIEPVRGQGKLNTGPTDDDPIDVWLRKERARLNQSRTK